MNVAYARVSTEDQRLDRQVASLQKHNIEKWFTEKISGKDMNRPELQKMLDFVREGDTVYVHDFSRLARSTKDLLEIIDILKRKKVNLVSDKESLDSSTPNGKLMLTMLAAINEFERDVIRERQAEGIALAKKRGAYKGRKKVEIPNFSSYYERYMSRDLNKSEMAKELHISRPTVNRLINEFEKNLA